MQDRLRIVDFVRQRHEAHGCRGVREVGDVSLFALLPWWLGCLVRVGAAVHDGGDRRAKERTNPVACRGATLVLHRIVQQGGDGVIFGPAVLEDQAGHSQQMRDVGDTAALPGLGGVELGRKDQGAVEPRR